MENGAFLDEDYFEHLLAEIREIRLSERRAFAYALRPGYFLNYACVFTPPRCALILRNTACRNVNFSAGAVVEERIGAQCGRRFRAHRNARQPAASVERPVADSRYVGAYINAHQPGTSGERKVVDTLHTGYGDARQPGTTVERIVADRGHAGAYGHAC